jgi:hypothetical protein
MVKKYTERVLLWLQFWDFWDFLKFSALVAKSEIGTQFYTIFLNIWRPSWPWIRLNIEMGNLEARTPCVDWPWTSSYWTAKSSFVFLTSDQLGTQIFGPWFFIILKNSHQDLCKGVKLYFEFTRSWSFELLKHSYFLKNYLKLQILASYNNLRIGQYSEFAKFWSRALTIK